jgi:hypothetical protein
MIVYSITDVVMSWRFAMTGKVRIFATLFALTAFLSTQAPAEAITVELAKKCRAMAAKAHPTPRAGTKTGEQKAQTAFFRDCVAKDGKVDEQKK